MASQFLAHLGAGTQDVFPVVDPAGLLIGVLTVTDLARISRDDRDRHQVLTAREVVRPSETLEPNDSLLEAMKRMGARGTGALPVVDPVRGNLVGLLSRSDVLGLYERILAGAPDPSPDAAPPAPGRAGVATPSGGGSRWGLS